IEPGDSRDRPVALDGAAQADREVAVHDDDPRQSRSETVEDAHGAGAVAHGEGVYVAADESLTPRRLPRDTTGESDSDETDLQVRLAAHIDDLVEDSLRLCGRHADADAMALLVVRRSGVEVAQLSRPGAQPEDRAAERS